MVVQYRVAPVTPGSPAVADGFAFCLAESAGWTRVGAGVRAGCGDGG